MTKEQLRTSYVDKGWEVQPVSDWTLVSSIEGKEKYDVNAVSPENKFGTAQVVVKDGEATALGFWVDAPTTFAVDLRAFIDTMEAGTIFAISVTEIKEADEIAEVKAYKESGSDVTVDSYVVKRRNDTFSFKKIV